MEEGAAATYERLEERRVRGDLEEWEQRALDHAAGLHDVLVRDGTNPRAAFAALCGNRYCAAPQCGSGAPPAAYVVCLSKEEAAHCIRNTDDSVTPLFAFQIRSHPEWTDDPLWIAYRKQFAFSVSRTYQLPMTFFSPFIRNDAITSIDFAGVRGVTEISNYFLISCAQLVSLDLSAFRGVTKVGTDFASYCTKLTSIDLSPLSALKRIPGFFLCGCSSLTSVDFSPLTNVTAIETSLLENSGVVTVNLHGLQNVTAVEQRFLTNCAKLTALELEPFRNVTQIDACFLEHCTSLRHADFRKLHKVRKVVPFGFLQECRALTPESKAAYDEFKLRVRKPNRYDDCDRFEDCAYNEMWW